MQKIKVLVVMIVVLCVVPAAWAGPFGLFGGKKLTHEMDVKSTQTGLMKYDSVAQGAGYRGQANVQTTLVGKPLQPSQAIVTEQVPVTVTSTPAAPVRPVYAGRCGKAVERTPPQKPTPVTKIVMQTKVTTITAQSEPKVLATSNAAGPTTGHSFIANIPAMVGMTTFGTTFGAFRKPDVTKINQSGGGAAATGGTGYGGAGYGGEGGIGSAAASASAAAAAAAEGGGGSGGHGGHGCR